MEAIFVTLASIAGGACLVFAAHRLGEAHLRLAVLRRQRQKDACSDARRDRPRGVRVDARPDARVDGSGRR